MEKKPAVTRHELTDDTNALLKWGKLLTRVTAIGATLTGAVSAFFSSSSVAGGVALSAAGASTLAAAEKIPDSSYVKTKHIPPTVAQRYEQVAREKAAKLKKANTAKFEQLKNKLKKPQKTKELSVKKNNAKPAKPLSVKKMLTPDTLPGAEKIDISTIKRPKRDAHIFRARASYETSQNSNLSLSDIDESPL